MNSTELRGYFTGLILGDGFIDHGITKRSFRIKSINLDFIDKIERDLENTDFNVRVRTFPETFREGIHRKEYKELTIRAHPYFTKLYHYFYNDYGERYIHSQTLEWLTDEGWANWYMSDGYIVKVGLTKGYIKDRRVELSTDRYPLSDVEMVRNYIEDNLGYKTFLVKRGGKSSKYRIKMSLLDAQKFFLRVQPYIVESMEYKLNLAYEYKPKWMIEEYYNLMESLNSAGRLTNPYLD